MHDQNVQARGHTRTVQRRYPVLPAARAPRHPQHGVLGTATTSRTKSIRLHQQIKLQSLSLLCLRRHFFFNWFFFNSIIFDVWLAHRKSGNVPTNVRTRTLQRLFYVLSNCSWDIDFRTDCSRNVIFRIAVLKYVTRPFILDRFCHYWEKSNITNLIPL